MLEQLLAAPPLVDRFSRRFLREAMIFPFDAGGGRFGLAVADPTARPLPRHCLSAFWPAGSFCDGGPRAGRLCERSRACPLCARSWTTTGQAGSAGA